MYGLPSSRRRQRRSSPATKPIPSLRPMKILHSALRYRRTISTRGEYRVAAILDRRARFITACAADQANRRRDARFHGVDETGSPAANQDAGDAGGARPD